MGLKVICGLFVILLLVIIGLHRAVIGDGKHITKQFEFTWKQHVPKAYEKEFHDYIVKYQKSYKSS